MPKALTHAAVRNAKPADKRTWVRDGETALYVQIEPYGTKAYVVRFRPAPGAAQISRTIGKVEDIDLDAARLRAADIIRAAKAAPEAPAAQPKRIGGITFGECLDAYAAGPCAEIKSGALRIAAMKKHCAAWLALPVASVTIDDAETLVDRLKKEGKGTTANRVVAYLKHFGSFIAKRPMRAVPANPFSELDRVHREVEREVTLSIPQLACVWLASERLGRPYSTLYRALILAGLRLREVAEAPKAEIDTTARLWTVPAERMKAGRAHHVPLSSALQAVINDALPGELLCPSPRTGRALSGWSKIGDSMRKEAAAIAEAADVDALPEWWTNHDIRRSVATALGEAPVYADRDTVEDVLAHSRTKLERTYNRSRALEKRLAVLEAWAAHITAEVERLRSSAEAVVKPKPDVAAFAADLSLNNSEAARRAGVTEAAVRKARKKIAAA